MEKNSPFVILNLEAHLPNDTSEKNLFYRCKSEKNVVDYIGRNNASTDENNLQYSQFCNELNTNFSVENNEKNILNYANNRFGSTGLFNENGFLKAKKINELKKKLQTTESIVWSAVISFTPEISSQLCKNPNEAQELLSNYLPLLFKNSKIDYENIEWNAAYHTNTDNRHIHLIMFEKEPKHINSSGQKEYTKKYTLPTQNLSNFKYKIASNIDKSKMTSYVLRKETKDALAFNLQEDKQFLSYLLYNTKDIIEQGKYQYNRLEKSQQNKINQLVKETLQRNPILQNQYNKYLTLLQNDQLCILDIFKHNNSTPSKEAKNYFKNRKNEFDTRLANTILKSIKDAQIAQFGYKKFKEYECIKKSRKPKNNLYICKKKAYGLNQSKSKNIMSLTNSQLARNLDFSLKEDMLARITKDMSIKDATKTMEEFLFEKRQQGEGVYE